MNAMTRFTLRSLRANRVRTLVTVAGVVLAAALLTAVLTTFTSLQSMLYRGEAAITGTWMAEVQDADRARLDAEVGAGLASGELTGAAMLQDAGFGELTEDQRNVFGTYLVLTGFSGDIDELCAVRPSSGRLPEAPGEIMLFDTWRTSGGLALGDTLTLPVGERRAVLAPGEEAGSSENVASGVLYDVTPASKRSCVVEDGSRLDSSIGFLNAEADGGRFNEELVDVRERSYTVVGFYKHSGYVASNGVGMTGFVGPGTEEAGGGVARAYVTMGSVDSAEAVQERADALFESSEVVLHTGMLRYMGIRTGGAIWDTFFGIASVLAVVIVAACVSLIYNAFAISVAERLRQFGLLASIGASRRQLRRAVALEAAAVALAGIPLGLVVGIGGCAVTFALIGPTISMLFGTADVGFELSVAPWALGAAAALTLVTVLVSAALPAWRASRVNAIDSLRGNQVSRASRRGAAQAARAVVPSRLWARRGLAGRVFGVGGLLARINGKRGTGRGRAASVSLALAIVLLMTAGSLSTFLGTLADTAGGGEPPADVAVYTDLFLPEGADGADEVGGPAAPLTAQEALRDSDEDIAAQAAVFSQAWEVLCATPDAEPVCWRMEGYVPVIMPEAMAGKVYRINGGGGGVLEDGRYAANGFLVFLDDAAFDRFVTKAGLDPAAYHEDGIPRAVGVAQGYGNDGSVYQLLETLRDTGTVEVVAAGVYDGRPVSGFNIVWPDRPVAGEPNRVVIEPYVQHVNADDSGSAELVDADQVDMALAPLEVAALVDEVPSYVGHRGEQLQLILPASVAQSHGFGLAAPTLYAAFNAPAGESGDVGQELVDRLGAFVHDETPYRARYLSMHDYAGNVESNRALALVVNVFCLLFTVILALIALANVFNTVTNGLILRRREFAVMRAMGLSGRQFRAMIVDECAAWCLRGLVPGIVLSLGISYLLFQSVSVSLSGLDFGLPWGYVVLAFAMTAAAIAISVAYGMRRCKADNVVEALRTDSA